MAPDVGREEARVLTTAVSGVAGKTSFLKRFELVRVKYSDFIIFHLGLDAESVKDEWFNMSLCWVNKGIIFTYNLLIS